MKLRMALLIAVLGLVNSVIGQTTRSPVTQESIRSDMQLHVCKNSQRMEAVKSFFKTKGVTDGEMRIEKSGDVENLVVVKKGKTDETIVVGAHYDKVSEGCGALDNWTGIVVLANLVAKFRNVETEKTIVFAAFGKEENGLVGARAMVKSIPKEKRGQYCAMVNLDTFGLRGPQVLGNASDKYMTRFAKELADEVKMPFAARVEEADADSTAFLEKDIPAITFHGLSIDWKNYLHSARDKIENVNHQAVWVGFNFTALYLERILTQPCGAFRK